MPLFILVIGIILVVAGINNKIPELVGLVKEDFKPTDGSTPFYLWVMAIIGVGALGYIKPLKGFSTGFLALILLVILLAQQKRGGVNGGFFDKFTQALKG